MTRQTNKPPRKVAVLRSIFKKKHKVDRKFSFDKNILQRLFHPDYILFDWEYFSRDLEFE